jgi:hypothetical protein
VVNFLFGGEMAVIGMQYDNSGFIWDWEVAKQQWSEEPLWVNLLNTTSLVGSMLFPAARAAHASAKFGKAATLLNRSKGISHSQEVDKFRKLGLIDSSGAVSNKTLELARRQEVYRSQYERLARRVEKADRGEPLGVMDRAKFEFQRRFSNSYFKIVNSLIDGNDDVRETFYKNLDGLFKSEDMGKFFRDMPDGEVAGQRIVDHWLRKNNPSLTGRNIKLTPQEQAWADTMETAMRAHQREALEIGFISGQTAKKVGELHIPALFKGTARPDVSTSRHYYLPMKSATDADQTVLRPFTMPRLDSPTMKVRKAEIPEVYDRLTKGQLITDPAELTTRGLVMDRLH